MGVKPIIPSFLLSATLCSKTVSIRDSKREKSFRHLAYWSLSWSYSDICRISSWSDHSDICRFDPWVRPLWHLSHWSLGQTIRTFVLLILEVCLCAIWRIATWVEQLSYLPHFHLGWSNSIIWWISTLAGPLSYLPHWSLRFAIRKIFLLPLEVCHYEIFRIATLVELMGHLSYFHVDAQHVHQ